MDEAPPTLQEVIAVHCVHALDDVADDVEGVPEDNVRQLIGATLDTVQFYYHLVPKKIVGDEGQLVDRQLPEDAVTDHISNIWNKVSN